MLCVVRVDQIFYLIPVAFRESFQISFEYLTIDLDFCLNSWTLLCHLFQLHRFQDLRLSHLDFVLLILNLDLFHWLVDSQSHFLFEHGSPLFTPVAAAPEAIASLLVRTVLRGLPGNARLPRDPRLVSINVLREA